MAESDLNGATVEQKLVTRTYDGIYVQPVYTRRDELGDKEAIGLPEQSPFVRGATTLAAVRSGWDLRQEYSHADLEVTNRAILEDLEGGVTSIRLRFDCAARNGVDADEAAANLLAPEDGLAAYCVDDLDKALDGVQLPVVGVVLEAGAAFVPATAMLVSLWRRCGIKNDEARGHLMPIPLAALAGEGRLPVSPNAALSLLAELGTWTAQNYPHVTAVGVSIQRFTITQGLQHAGYCFCDCYGRRISAVDDGGGHEH